MEIQKVYLDFLEKMGQDDEFDYDDNTLLLSSSHWSEAIFSLEYWELVMMMIKYYK